jgi:hypothetical protein
VPNIDGSVGSIVVSNDVGFVVLNRAFEAVRVSSRDTAPAKPTILMIDENNIDNFMIISPPKEVKDKLVQDAKGNNPLDVNELDIDLLKIDFFDKDELKFNELDVSQLDQVVFENVLDISDGKSSDGVVPGQNPTTGVITIKQDPDVEVIRMTSKAMYGIRFIEETGVNLNTTQGEMTINIITMDGQSSNFIRLIQQ